MRRAHAAEGECAKLRAELEQLSAQNDDLRAGSLEAVRQLETIQAECEQLRMRVAAVTIVVNLASGMTKNDITHEETIHFGNLAAEKVTKLVLTFIGKHDEWAAKGE